MLHPFSIKVFTIGLILFFGNFGFSPIWPSQATLSENQILTKYDIRKGLFLVATPSLVDPSFQESVVLICDHGDKGTLGLIINRPTEYPLSKVFPDIPGLSRFAETLSQGGPVQPQGLLMIFKTDKGSPNTQMLFDGVHWGGDPGMIASMVENPHPENQFRVFFGYAGWSPEQLENEINREFWTTVPATAELLFDHDLATLWEELREQSTPPRLLVSSSPFPSS